MISFVDQDHAEDDELFGRHNLFHNYLSEFYSNGFRKGIIGC